MVEKVIHQFDTHLNRDSLMEDLNKTAEFSQFSEKSKELISSMGNMEYFELCEISSKMQCPDSLQKWEKAWYIARAANACCSLRKEIDSWSKIDTTSCQSPFTSLERIRPMEPDMDQRCGRKSTHEAHDMFKKAQKKQCNTILERWYEDDLFRRFFV